MPLAYPRLLTLSISMLVASAGLAQTAAPAADSAAAPAAASRPAQSPANQNGNAAEGEPAAWDRPADGPALFTEDFESGAIDPKKFSIFATGNATVTVEHDFVAHGKSALHIHYPAGARNAISFLAMSVPAALHDHLYGRAYVYMQTIPSGHCVLMTTGSSGYPTSNFLEIGMRQNHFQPSYQQNGPNIARYEDHPLQGVPPAGRWFCLEWELTDKPDRIVMWIDGKLAVNETFKDQAGKNTGLTGGFVEYCLGFRDWSAPPRDVDIYYDDIALSDKPIGQLSPVPTPAAPPASGSAAQ